VAGAVVVSAAAVGIGAGLRHRAPEAEPSAATTPLSPEEVALQRDVAARPRDPLPWRKLGELYTAQRQPFEAVWALQEALERGPAHGETELHLAGALESAGLYRPAIDVLAPVVRREPQNREARLRLARLYLEIGEAPPAVATLREAGGDLHTWGDGLLELGRARQLAGDLPGAIATYRKHLEVEPDSVEGAIRAARALLEAGELDPARRVLEHGRLSAPRDPRFPFYLGLSWIQEGHPQKPERAMENFREALLVAPDHPLPNHFTGLLLARQGRWPEAQARFFKATQADPTYAEPQLYLSRSMEKTGDRAEAKEQLGVYYFLKDDSLRAAEAFRQMEKTDPKNVQAARLVSLAYLRMGRNDWAIRETKAALLRHPGDVTLLERLATLYIMTHSRIPARKTCEEWLKQEPGAARAHWLLGRIAQDDLKVPEAIREYETALRGDPENPEYLASMASALNDAGGRESLTRAAELLRQAVRQDPKKPGYRHDLGMTLLQLGDLEGARREFLAALDLSPNHAPAYSGLSQLCVRLRKPALGRFFAPLVRATTDRSREELRLSRRVSHAPEDASAHYELARFLMAQPNFALAQSHLERALELRAAYPEAKAAREHVRRVMSIR
jgi:tetratricopeptide (TPR) repeat protein